MDFLIEIVLQLVVQLVVELLYELLLRLAWRGAAHLVRNLFTGFALSFVAGLAVGVLWGQHLAGNATWPKLFWVSIALGVAAFGYAVVRTEGLPSGGPGAPSRSAVLTPPWRWDAERLVGFALINAGIAVGIAGAFGPSWVPAT